MDKGRTAMRGKAGFYEFVKYFMSGGTAAVSHLIVLWIGVEFVGLGKLTAATISCTVAILVNYSLQYWIVFAADHGYFARFGRYLLVTLPTLGLNLFFFDLLANKLHVQYLLAQTIVILVLFVCNFLINKYYTFSQAKLS